MKGKLSILGLGVSLCALAVSGCDILTGGSTESEIPEATSDVSGEGGMIGMANPASVYCEDQGYTLEIRSDAEGNEYGVCIFPDGSECEEWAFFRGECAPGSQAVEEPVAEPAEEPAVPANAVNVTCEWISFSYDASLASGVTGEIVPAEDGVSAWGGSPEHIECAFNDYILPNTFHEPRLCVYPIADFVAVAPSAETTVTNMEQLLAARPEILPGGGLQLAGCSLSAPIQCRADGAGRRRVPRLPEWHRRALPDAVWSGLLPHQQHRPVLYFPGRYE